MECHSGPPLLTILWKRVINFSPEISNLSGKSTTYFLPPSWAILRFTLVAVHKRGKWYKKQLSQFKLWRCNMYSFRYRHPVPLPGCNTALLCIFNVAFQEKGKTFQLIFENEKQKKREKGNMEGMKWVKIIFLHSCNNLRVFDLLDKWGMVRLYIL